MQDKDSKSYDQIQATIDNSIREIERRLPHEDPPELDLLVSRHKEISEHINRFRKEKSDVDINVLKIIIDQYQSLLLSLAASWKSSDKVSDKHLIPSFEQKVSEEIAALKAALSLYKPAAQQGLNVRASAPVVGFTTVDPQPLPAALTFIDQLKACSPGGTVTEKEGSAQSKSYEIKYPAISTIKNITVTRSETGQVSTSTADPNPKTLKEMLSILENLEPKGKKALKIDAQDKETLQTIHDLAISEGHTVNLTDAQKQTLEIAEPPSPASPN